MKKKIDLTPLALTPEELRSSCAFEKRAKKHGTLLDAALGELLREVSWRRIIAESEAESISKLFEMQLASRRVAISDRSQSVHDLAEEEHENELMKLLGDFPPVRPFSETPPGAIIGEDPLGLPESETAALSSAEPLEKNNTENQ